MNNNHTDIQKAAQEHKITPRPELWDRIESKLDVDQSSHRSLSYLRWASAAMVVAVLSTTMLFSNYLDGKKDFAQGEYLVSLEQDHEEHNSPIYTVEEVEAFKKAYLNKVVH